MPWLISFGDSVYEVEVVFKYMWGFFGHIGQQTIDVYIADIQARLKHLHVEELGTK